MSLEIGVVDVFLSTSWLVDWKRPTVLPVVILVVDISFTTSFPIFDDLSMLIACIAVVDLNVSL